ncbi:MAG: hypothetical protein JXR91_00355 [Deltaproteobacteria bacterium]|nr:hypothetical protein [Deltaproteobacteria bacterium]
MTKLDFIFLGLRMWVTGMVRKVSPQQYSGSAAEICEQIVDDCFDKKRGYFSTSITTYKEMWSRDFGRCAPALVQTGFGDRVEQTYEFALRAYEREGGFALTVLPNGNLYNFPFRTYSPDGFAFFVYGMCSIDGSPLIKKYRPFIEKEAKRFAETVINRETGLVKEHRHFSEARDYVKRNSSTYSNSISYLLQQSLNKLDISNPLEKYDYPNLLADNFYNPNTKVFFDDINKQPYISGDANILPFWTGAMSQLGQNGYARYGDISFENSVNILDIEGLNTPYPTLYGRGKSGPPSIRLDWINPWQHNTVWTCLGIHLLETMSLYMPKRVDDELLKYKNMIENLKAFPEVLNVGTGDYYSNFFYKSETGMLWASNILALLKNPTGFRHTHRS